MNKNQDRDKYSDENEDRVHSATRDRKRDDENIEALIASLHMCNLTQTALWPAGVQRIS